MEKITNFIKKVVDIKENITKNINSGTGNVTPENSTIEEVAEFKAKQKKLEDYEKSFDDNQAA